MSQVQKLFTEVFRPKKLEMLIAPSRIKDLLNKGLHQNLLLEGPAGTGKTTTAYILAGGRDNPDCKYINAAVDGRIEIIQGLREFCSTQSLLGGGLAQKVIIFDEVDGASAAFFDAMKSFIEQFHVTTRFIMTCNVVTKIPAPILSRMEVVTFRPINSEETNYMMGEYKTRIATILSKLNIGYSDETLNRFIKSDFPDMRKLMNKTQSLHLSGSTMLDDSTMITTYTYRNLFELCVKPQNPVECYKLVQSEYSMSVQECMQSLGDDFIQYLQEFHPTKIDKLPMVIITVADYQYKLASVIDPAIALQALIFSLQQILK